MTKRLWFATLVTAALFIALQLLEPKHEVPELYGYRSPGLALQMSHNWAQLSTILSLEPAQKARFVTQTYVDYGFLLAYGTLFSLLILHVYEGQRRWALLGLAVGAALCDAMENVWILAVLELKGGYEDYMAQSIHRWALLKYFLVSCAWLAIGIGQPRQGRRLILGILYTAGGLIGLWACLDNHRIPTAFLPIAIALLAQLWIYWPSNASASFNSRATASGSSL